MMISNLFTSFFYFVFLNTLSIFIVRDVYGQITPFNPCGSMGTFGRSISVSQNTALIGASSFPFNTSIGFAAGAAFIFTKTPSSWVQIKELQPSDLEWFDYFGWSVSIDGDYALIGSPRDEAFGIETGAAYIFKKDQGGPDNWGEQTKLLASDASSSSRFGDAVSLGIDIAMVGAPNEDTLGLDEGAFYLYKKNQGGPDNWGFLKKVTAVDGPFGGQPFFAHAIATNGMYAFAGTYLDDPGFQYIYKRDFGGIDNWGYIKTLPQTDVENFGLSVAIAKDNSIAVVGAVGNSSYYGAVYVYGKDQGGPDNWGLQKKVTPDDAPGNRFGRSISLSDDANFLLVGAELDDNIFGMNAGSSYSFERNLGGPDSWGQLRKILPNVIGNDTQFGSVVAIGPNDTAILGHSGNVCQFQYVTNYTFINDTSINNTTGPIIPDNCVQILSNIGLSPAMCFGDTEELFINSTVIVNDTADIGKTILNINGDFILSNDSLLIVELVSPDIVPIVVTGCASLRGSLRLDVSSPFPESGIEHFTVISYESLCVDSSEFTSVDVIRLSEETCESIHLVEDTYGSISYDVTLQLDREVCTKNDDNDDDVIPGMPNGAFIGIMVMICCLFIMVIVALCILGAVILALIGTVLAKSPLVYNSGVSVVQWSIGDEDDLDAL